MPSIRSHTKTRHGCARCKERKVKCDGIRPICGRCCTRLEACSYQTDQQQDQTQPLCTSQPTLSDLGIDFSSKLQEHIRRPDSGTPTSTDAPVATNSGKTSNVGMSLDDLEWYQYFILRTAATLSFHGPGLSLGQWALPQAAAKHPCLLHLMLAVGALHRLAIDPGPSAGGCNVEKCFAAAEHHQTIALSLYVDILTTNAITMDLSLCLFNILFQVLPFAWRAALGTAKLNPGSLAMYIHDNQNEPHPVTFQHSSAVTTFVRAVMFWKGSNLMFDQYRTSTTSEDGSDDLRGAIDELLRPPNLRDMASLSSTAVTSLELLTGKVKAIADRPTRDFYLNELSRVEFAMCCAGAKDTQAFVMSYPSNMTAQAADLLCARDEIMLSILACWAASVYQLNDRWWIRGWAEELLQESLQLLSAELSEMLVWPIQCREQIHLDGGKS